MIKSVVNNFDIYASMGDGIIQVFCRENAPYDRAVFKLRGLKYDRNYIFTDIDDDSSFTLNGKELLEKGLPLEISEKRKAKIYMYKGM